MLAALDGDSAAQGELLRTLSGYLRAYYARRIGDHAAEVEDLVQEALIAIHFKRHTYDRTRPFMRWAYAVARHKLVDHFRRTGSRAEAPLEAADTLFANDEISARTARHDLGKLLAELPARHRTLLEDVKIVGLSVKEASAKAGISLAAGKVNIHRAMKTLAQRAGREDG